MSKINENINKQIAKGIGVLPYEHDFAQLPDDYPSPPYLPDDYTFPPLPEGDPLKWLHDDFIKPLKKLEPLKPLPPLKTEDKILEELSLAKEKINELERQIKFTNTTVHTSINADLENLYSESYQTKKKSSEDNSSTKLDNTITALEARTLSNQPQCALRNIYEDINNTAQFGGTKIAWRTENLSGDCVYKIIDTLRADGFKCTNDAFDPFTIIISW